MLEEGGFVFGEGDGAGLALLRFRDVWYDWMREQRGEKKG